MKKKIALLMCLAVLGTTTTAFADNKTLSINGTSIETQVIDGTTFIPVRAAADALGFQVDWNGEIKRVALSKGAMYVTFTIGVNGYTFAKTAPMPLSHEPIIIDDYAYVPFDILTDIMALNPVETEAGIEITLVDETVAVDDAVLSDDAVSVEDNINEDTATEEKVVEEAIISEINEDNILIVDGTRGDVVLNIYEDSEIVDSDGNAISIDDLKVGDYIEVVYGDAMTMSIPPINNPVSITLIK